MTVVSDYTAILGYLDKEYYRFNATEEIGFPVFVSYAFTPQSDLPALSDLAFPADTVQEMSAAQKESVREALAVFEAVAGITFIEVTGEAMVNAMTVSGSGYGGWATYPNGSAFFPSSGSMIIDTDGAGAFTGFEFETVLHEIGHAVGLSHPHGAPITLVDSLDNTKQTLMSYNSVSDPKSSLGPLDVEALVHIYGTPANMKGWSYGTDNGTFSVRASARDDRVMGLNMDNHLDGRKGDDILVGRTGDDTLIGGRGNDILMGYAGSDTLLGGAGRDTLIAHIQDDIYYTDNSKTLLKGGAGKDNLLGGDGMDTLRGGNGDDRLAGDYNDDTLLGGNGNDRMLGDGGRDTLIGGAGNDKMTGGTGGDTFVFDPSRDGKRDIITDFNEFSDTLEFTKSTITEEDMTTKASANGRHTLLTVDAPDGGTFKISFRNLVEDDLNRYLDFYHDFG